MRSGKWPRKLFFSTAYLICAHSQGSHSENHKKKKELDSFSVKKNAWLKNTHIVRHIFLQIWQFIGLYFTIMTLFQCFMEKNHLFLLKGNTAMVARIEKGDKWHKMTNSFKPQHYFIRKVFILTFLFQLFFLVAALKEGSS